MSDDEENCFEVVSNAIADQAGIVDIQVDTAREQVAFEYDPAIVHDEAIVTLARKVEPTLRQRFDTCTLFWLKTRRVVSGATNHYSCRSRWLDDR